MFRSAMLRFLEKYDVIICPVNAYPALPHGTTFENDNLAAFSYTETYNLTGWPAVVVRGDSAEGLPIGVQIVSRPGVKTWPWQWPTTSKLLWAVGNARRSRS